MSESKSNGLKAVDANTFLNMELPEREAIIEPVIYKQSISMVYAARGIGKTNFSLTLAAAIACGKNMFDGRWKVPKAMPVLYIDGEMPSNALQKRLGKIKKYFGVGADLSNLEILTPDLLPVTSPFQIYPQ